MYDRSMNAFITYITYILFYVLMWHPILNRLIYQIKHHIFITVESKNWQKNYSQGRHFYSHPWEYLQGKLGIQPCHNQNIIQSSTITPKQDS